MGSTEGGADPSQRHEALGRSIRESAYERFFALGAAVVASKRRRNFSTRPAVSTSFWVPVKKGWQEAQIPKRT